MKGCLIVVLLAFLVLIVVGIFGSEISAGSSVLAGFIVGGIGAVFSCCVAAILTIVAIFCIADISMTTPRRFKRCVLNALGCIACILVVVLLVWWHLVAALVGVFFGFVIGLVFVLIVSA